MDVLPSGTKALCALFESKASLQRGFSSSPRLNPASAPARSTAGGPPPREGRGHTETTIQVRQVRAHFTTLTEHTDAVVPNPPFQHGSNLFSMYKHETQSTVCVFFLELRAFVWWVLADGFSQTWPYSMDRHCYGVDVLIQNCFFKLPLVKIAAGCQTVPRKQDSM